MIDIEVKPGYLYLLRNTLLGGYKIGITTAPTSRFKALAVGDKTELIGYWQTDAYRELEKYYHKLYKEERCPQSEWFKLEPEMVDDIVQQMHSSAATQYLEEDRAPEFVGPQFRFVVPTEDTHANWKYFSVLVLAMSLAYTIGALIQ